MVILVNVVGVVVYEIQKYDLWLLLLLMVLELLIWLRFHAVMDLLNLCLNRQLHNIEIEPDSLIVVNWLRGKGPIHWSLIGFLEEFYLYR